MLALLDTSIKTYGLGVVLASSFFFFHHIMSALKTSCPRTEERHWKEVVELGLGFVVVYSLGLLARSIWGVL